MELKSCPFCGGQASLWVSDREGNIRDEDYENDPWSGLGFQIRHEQINNQGCPIASHEHESVGILIYDSREEASDTWNNRNGQV